MKTRKYASPDLTQLNDLSAEFLKLWRQLDDEAKDRIEAELRRLLMEEHGSWDVGLA